MHRNLTIVALALAGLFTTTAAAVNIHYVELNGDIQSVIDNASTGDTIQLAAGQYDITTTLDPGGKAVTIMGTWTATAIRPASSTVGTPWMGPAASGC
jgi:hypothetical protein